MVECMIIWPHNISRFTCVNVFYHYGWVKEQEPINLSLCESSRFRHIGRLKSSYIFGHMFYKFFGFVNVSIFTLSYSYVKSICNFLSLLE